MRRLYAGIACVVFMFVMIIFQLSSIHAMQEEMKRSVSEEVLLKQKIAECPFLKSIFSADAKWIFSKENEMLYANLVKDSKTFVFGYRPSEKKDWGENLPRWYFAVGSMELGLVVASFNGVVKDGKYIPNNLACLSKKCPIPDIHASVNYNGIIEQISIDENCDKFFDKIYNVNIKPDPNYGGNEAWAQAVKIVSDDLKRLYSGSW